jgi:hypothetical protein
MYSLSVCVSMSHGTEVTHCRWLHDWLTKRFCHRICVECRGSEWHVTIYDSLFWTRTKRQRETDASLVLVHRCFTSLLVHLSSFHIFLLFLLSIYVLVGTLPLSAIFKIYLFIISKGPSFSSSITSWHHNILLV